MSNKKIITALSVIAAIISSAGLVFLVGGVLERPGVFEESIQASVSGGISNNFFEVEHDGGDNDNGGYENRFKESSETAVVSIEDDLAAKSFFAVTINGGVSKELFSEKSKEKIPIASLVKLMTALLVLEEYPMDYLVAVSEKAMEQDGNQGSLRPGEVFSAKDLLYMILLESSNRAAYALSEVIGNELFVVKMNRKAMELGLRNTYFEDVTGLSPNSYSSAEDVALLSKHLFSTYPLFKDIIGAREMNFYLPDGTFHHRGVNTNQLLGVNSIIGGKTGWTNAARGCLMVIQQNVGSDAYTIYVVLGAEDRFWEMRKLMHNVTRNAFAI